ncbi:MAG TPA: DUF3857 domain-containing transglutaminase family protein [Thermoanaerobaculia bacterium]|nr:DUF3857 domain-containing transglutaminase family protein [Thermoanaerobaculia bacterium]
MRIATVLLLAALAPAAVAGRGDLPPWIRASIPAELPPAGDATAQVLLDERFVTVNHAGDIATRHRRVVKILTAAGREEAFLGVPFDDATKIKSMNGWSIDRNGTEYTLRMRDAVESSLGDYELYTDAKMKSFRVPADIGSVVAFEYEQSERPYLLQSTWYFQENVPVLRARFQLVLPPGWSHDAKWINYTAAQPVAPGTWELQSIPAIVDEPRRPSRIALSGRVGFNFLAPEAKPLGWSDVASWYLHLANPRSTPTPPLQAKVRELTKDTPDPIAPLARFAQRDVRYIAVEIGIGGYQPHAAGDIFANRYGDCKDKATLLRTMLKEVGIDAYYVLVHATRGATKPEFPSIGAFNHVISAIPVSAERAKTLHAVIDHPKLGKLLLFDPTSTLTPLGQLPEYLQDSRGLLVTNDGGELMDLPAHAPEVNLLRRTATLQLGADGTLVGTVEEVRKGSMASNMRASLQSRTAAERVHYVQSVLASHLAAVTAENIVVQNLDDPESDLVVRYTIVAPDYAKRVADMLLIRPRVIGQKAETLIDPKRNYEYVTDGPSLQNDDVEIRLPPAVKLDELPPKVEIRTPLVQYASASTFENGVLRYKRRYSMNTFAIPREKFSELNGVWKQILGDERASAVFK